MTCARGKQVDYHSLSQQIRQQYKQGQTQGLLIFRVQLVLFKEKCGINAEVWDQAAVVYRGWARPALSNLSTSHCLTDRFCIPVLEPPCYGLAHHIHTAVTVVDIPYLPSSLPLFLSPTFFHSWSLVEASPMPLPSVIAIDLTPVVVIHAARASF